MQMISVQEANQNFMSVLANVEHGERVALTRFGQIVAHISPVILDNMLSSIATKSQKAVTGADLFLSLDTQPHELADWFEPSDDFEDTVSFDE